MTFICSENESPYGVAFFYHVINRALEVHVYVFMVHEFSEHEFGVFEVVGLSGLAYHVVVGNAEEFYEFVAHGSFAYHAENRAYVACSKVSAYHAVAFYQCDFGAVTCRSYCSAYSGRAGSSHDNVVACLYLDFFFVMK